MSPLLLVLLYVSSPTKLTLTLSLAGIVLASVIGVQVYRAQRYLRVTRGVSLHQESGDGSLWEFDGQFLRPRHGKFRGWYLSVDHPDWRSVPLTRSKVLDIFAESLTLTERPTETSHWKPFERNGELSVIQDRGPFGQMAMAANAIDLNPATWFIQIQPVGQSTRLLNLEQSAEGTHLLLEDADQTWSLAAPLDGEIETLDLWAEPELSPESEQFLVPVE
ncbi:MAG: hypothetical protein AAF488_15575 [Planctomycetota bacterium]